MKSKYGGYTGKVLRINLSTKEISNYPWTDGDRRLFIGGKIMAAKILYDNLLKGTDPLGEDNMLVITTGPFTGSAVPSSSRFNISTLSPLTGFIASSNCGGSFGINLKKSGYDALIITGKSEEKLWIEIINEEVKFHNAEEIWGKLTGETQTLLGKKTGKIVIGPAGENLVKFASIISEERVAGRAGVGAVMGSKNLKAVVASGNTQLNLFDREKTRKLNKKWVSTLKAHPITGVQLPKLGTAGLISAMNVHKILATKNFKRGQYEDFEKISGEHLAEKYLIKNKGCITCPIQCGRVVEVGGKAVKGPELETLGLLGSNIENNDIELIFKWNYELDELGMDTISTAGTIAFGMELKEKGLLESSLVFGKTDNLSQVFEAIAYRKGVGDILAEGSKKLSEKFGGKEFAMHSKGLELSAYEPRNSVGQGLGYAMSNRGGCHLNGGYLVILEGLGMNIDSLTPRGKAELTILFQNLMEAVSACGSCLFTTYTAIPKIMVSKPNNILTILGNKLITKIGPIIGMVDNSPAWLMKMNLPSVPHTKVLSAITGMNIKFGDFKEIGERGYNLERLFNIKMGLTEKDDSLPKRLTEELMDNSDIRTRVPLNLMKSKYYKVRGWDEEGIPTREKLKELDLVRINND
jgi:aldehyde:ferredoxin oxidoreductase